MKSTYISAVHCNRDTGNLRNTAGNYIRSSHGREGNRYIINMDEWG